MVSTPDDPRHWRTARLELDAIGPDDVDELVARNAESTVWWNFPPVAATDDDELAALTDRIVAGWERDGLGYWAVRAAGSRVLLGVGGCAQFRGPAWSVYYRLRTSAQGQGLAEEVVGAGLEWAARTGPALPVVARLRERNVRARAVVEEAGLSLVWHADSEDGDEAGRRLLYADRDVPSALLDVLTAP